jgi:hypothetical protein
MVFTSQLAIGLFNLIWVCGTGNAERFVIVFEFHQAKANPVVVLECGLIHFTDLYRIRI